MSCLLEPQLLLGQVMQRPRLGGQIKALSPLKLGEELKQIMPVNI